MYKRLGLLFFAAAAAAICLAISDNLPKQGSSGIVSSAQARVGRPLTPMSVAGVARRTARRCAAGVYYC
jgi:hypothetical protein